eukprot:2328382-Prymnesium_polylepis.1
MLIALSATVAVSPYEALVGGRPPTALRLDRPAMAALIGTACATTPHVPAQAANAASASRR